MEWLKCLICTFCWCEKGLPGLRNARVNQPKNLFTRDTVKQVAIFGWHIYWIFAYVHRALGIAILGAMLQQHMQFTIMGRAIVFIACTALAWAQNQWSTIKSFDAMSSWTSCLQRIRCVNISNETEMDQTNQ